MKSSYPSNYFALTINVLVVAILRDATKIFKDEKVVEPVDSTTIFVLQYLLLNHVKPNCFYYILSANNMYLISVY